MPQSRLIRTGQLLPGNHPVCFYYTIHRMTEFLVEDAGKQEENTIMQTVSFIHMADGTTEDYEFLDKLEQQYAAKLPERIEDNLRKLENSLSGYKVTRLEHSLQSGTRAYRDGRDTDYVVAALIHDIGDELAPYSHSEMAASILRPFVSNDLYQIVRTHGVFQIFYYGDQTGINKNLRERYSDQSWYQEAIEFCEKYDQNCFDPEYDSEPLEFFRPMLKEVFTRQPVFGETAEA